MAGTRDITIKQGDTYKDSIKWEIDNTPVDLTGFSILMQIRCDYADFETTTVLEASTTGGEIVIPTQSGSDEGRFNITLPASTTELINENGELLYDIELTSPSGEVTTLLEGEVTLNREVSRD